MMKRAGFLRILMLAPLGARRVSAATPSTQSAVRFLLRSQSADGAWRSDTYGGFQDGRALTPHVLRSLSRIADPALASSKQRAASWLITRDDLFDDFPIHIASAVLESSATIGSLAPLKTAALRQLLRLQTPGGGWSYSPVPVSGKDSSAPMQQPNLSATAIAIDGLRAAGGQSDAIARALPFIRKCQNHATGDSAFDDGGFFQMPLDPTRNKAGRAGTDRHGSQRFRSYAAATADGLRCLLSSGASHDSPEVGAARRWLDGFPWSPASPPPDLAYYCARSISKTASLPGGSIRAAITILRKLNKAALPDGSWKNPHPEMRENDAIVATALALEATLDIPSEMLD